jgi:hypothetical protein
VIYTLLYFHVFDQCTIKVVTHIRHEIDYPYERQIDGGSGRSKGEWS